MQIIDVSDSLERMGDVRELFLEYAAEVGINFNFQHFEQELRDLPGRYAAPAGCILLAELDGELAGCIAIRPLDERTAELKRMYVRPGYRRRGLAAALGSEALQRSFECRYHRVRLDTLKSMSAVRALYASFGFKEIPAYYDNPIPDVIYYELDFLAEARSLVAANLDQIGDGPWGVVIYDDDDTDMQFVHMLLNQTAGLRPDVASAVMHMTHLHGSAIMRRFASRDEAQELHAALQGFILRSNELLKTGVMPIRAG